MNIDQLFHMDGYAVYVWTAYCITLIVFGINLFATFREKNKTKKIVRRYVVQHYHEQ